MTTKILVKKTDIKFSIRNIKAFIKQGDQEYLTDVLKVLEGILSKYDADEVY